jgi:hypothetical protein
MKREEGFFKKKLWIYNNLYHHSKVCNPDFDPLFGCHGEVRADGVNVDQVTSARNRLLDLPTWP